MKTEVPSRVPGVLPKASPWENPSSSARATDKQSVALFMFKTYILQSEIDRTFYYGHTKNLESRLKDHNRGKVRSTKSKRPWNVYYYETYETKSEAYRREMFFKTVNGYKFLREQGIIK